MRVRNVEPAGNVFDVYVMVVRRDLCKSCYVGNFDVAGIEFQLAGEMQQREIGSLRCVVSGIFDVANANRAEEIAFD